MPRTFVAVKVNPTAELFCLLDELGRLGPAIKPITPQNLHITLMFLGQVEDTLLEPATRALQIAVKDVSAFEMPLVGVDVYPHRKRPSVVWVGVTNASDLSRIVGRLTRAMPVAGLTCPSRPWSPHLTVARVKSKPPKAFGRLLDHHRPDLFGTTKVRSVQLMLSRLDPSGPHYAVMTSALLQPPAAGRT